VVEDHRSWRKEVSLRLALASRDVLLHIHTCVSSDVFNQISYWILSHQFFWIQFQRWSIFLSLFFFTKTFQSSSLKYKIGASGYGLAATEGGGATRSYPCLFSLQGPNFYLFKITVSEVSAIPKKIYIYKSYLPKRFRTKIIHTSHFCIIFLILLDFLRMFLL
jgi:hypothetical protein